VGLTIWGGKAVYKQERKSYRNLPYTACDRPKKQQS